MYPFSSPFFFKDKIIDVKIFVCEDGNCYGKISYDTHAVYLPMYNASSWDPLFLDNMPDTNALIEKILDQWSGSRELTENDFEVNNVLISIPIFVIIYLD